MPYPGITFPSPRTWAAGPVKAPALRGDVADAIAFLISRPLFAAQNSTGPAYANSTDGSVGLDTELYDNWNGHSTSTATAQYFCAVPGWYLCKSVIPWSYGSAAQALFAGGFSGLNNGVALPIVRGGLQLTGSTNSPAPQTVDLIQQTVTGPIGGSGDYIQPTAFQVSGATRNLLSSSSTERPTVTVRWVCANSGTASLPVPANPAWPVPPSYVTSAFLNANIRDTINFLIYPPVCKAYYVAGTTTLPSTTFPAGTVISLTNTAVDNYAGFTTGATGGYTAPVTGNYFVYGQVSLMPDTNSTGYCAGLSVAGGTTIWGDSVNKVSDTTGGGATVQKRLRLTAGQKVQLVGCQGSGAAIAYNTVAANQTRMIVCWEGS